jgi:hypothetical protein
MFLVVTVLFVVYLGLVIHGWRTLDECNRAVQHGEIKHEWIAINEPRWRVILDFASFLALAIPLACCIGVLLFLAGPEEKVNRGSS